MCMYMHIYMQDAIFYMGWAWRGWSGRRGWVWGGSYPGPAHPQAFRTKLIRPGWMRSGMRHVYKFS